MNVSELKTNRALRRVVLLALVIVALLVVSVFSVRGILSARQEYRQEQQLLNQSNTELTQLQQMAKDEEKSKQLLEEYQQLLPEQMSQDVILAHLSKLAEQTGVEVSTTSFSPAEQVETGNRLPFTVSLKGSYTSVMQLLEGLSLDGQLTLVDQLNLTGDTANGKNVTATAQLSAYYQ